MSIQASISSPDLTRQIEVLKLFPEITARHYRPALDSAVRELEAQIRPNIPVSFGRAKQTFHSQVSGRNIENLKGQVGWFGSQNDAWYINIVEYGARQHPLKSAQGIRSGSRNARFQSALAQGEKFGGQSIYIKGAGWRTMAIHPGFSARGFLAAGYSASQPLVEREMGAAGDKVVAELAAI